MNRLILTVAAGLIAIPATAQSPAGSVEFPNEADYAWGFPVIVQEEASFFSVALPLEVNQSVTDPELRDAGVYNADGEPVPRVFRPASDDVEQIERYRPLPFIPLFTNTDTVDNDGIRLLFERRGDYAMVELAADEDTGDSVARELSSYIVDTRQLEEAIEALDLYWTQSDIGFVGNIIVEGSGDLQNWNRLGSAAIADINENSASIVQRRIDLSKTTHDFLRISWNDLPADWGLAEINGVYTLGVPGIIRETITLEQTDIDPTDGGRIFSLGGTPKTDRIRIVLPETNTVITSDIYLWSENRLSWYRVAQGNWHHFGQDENVVESDAVTVPHTRSPRIKIVVTRGQPDVDMQLEIGWRPDTLLFLAQGPAPYTLVTGRARDAHEGYPQHALYGMHSIAGLATDVGRAASATLGPRYSLGGAGQLQVEDSIDWQTLILWLALALGVGFVGFMAVRILRDSKNS